MNVRELIEKLETLDPDLPVFVYVNETETYGEVRDGGDVNEKTSSDNHFPYAKTDVPKACLPFVLIESDYRG